jgi:hypothetical protein
MYRRFAETINTLRARYRTVLALSALSTLIYIIVDLPPEKVPEYIIFILGTSLALIAWILLIGYLRTIFETGNKEVSFAETFRTGKPFFWRTFAAVFLIYLAIFLLILLLSLLFSVFSEDTVYAFASLAAMKLLLFIPLIIVLKDCTIKDSFIKANSIKWTDASYLILPAWVSNMLNEILSENIFEYPEIISTQAFALITGVFLMEVLFIAISTEGIHYLVRGGFIEEETSTDQNPTPQS